MTKPLRIAIIGNYVPRLCGIATFTRDLVESLIMKKGNLPPEAEAFVIAMNNQDKTYAYPAIVKEVIKETSRMDYLKAAKYINFSNTDACILQHEFGIFGGESGRYILYLIQILEKPLIVTFHTVLKDPSPLEKKIVREISRKARYVVVMSTRAVDFLREIYRVPREKIKLILHGVPDLSTAQLGEFKQMLQFEKKRTLLTFGLLSRNKGIETVIKALPEVVKAYPEIMYIILGKTHPNVVEESGEEYRSSLKRMVESLRLRKHVYFDDRYISNEELFFYLTAVDIYITPYLNEAQITSGTLSYAIGAGAAVISTPYWHAEEILAEGRGRLFPFKDSAALGKILIELFRNPEKLELMREKAYQFGRKTTWPEIGSEYLGLISRLRKKQHTIKVKEEPIINPHLLPAMDLSHIRRLTDDTGIIQHAKYIIPNLKEGYCLDDNARALMMATMIFRQSKDREAAELISVYLGFIHYMQNEDGTFHNILGFGRDFKDLSGSDDAFGRAIWALGYFIRFAPNREYKEIATQIFRKSIPVFRSIRSIRGIANSIAGISHFLSVYPEEGDLWSTLQKMASSLVDEYKQSRKDDWHWFEPVLAYDNGIIPFSLFHAYKLLGDKKLLTIAKESMGFLEKVTFRDGRFSPVGSDGWYPEGKDRADFAQQPIDALAMILMYYQAFRVLKDKKYIPKLMNTFMWFLGENDLSIPVYDFETRGCRDGIESEGVSLNQGAESTICYVIAQQVVISAHDIEVRDLKNAGNRKV